MDAPPDEQPHLARTASLCVPTTRCAAVGPAGQRQETCGGARLRALGDARGPRGFRYLSMCVKTNASTRRSSVTNPQVSRWASRRADFGLPLASLIVPMAGLGAVQRLQQHQAITRFCPLSCTFRCARPDSNQRLTTIGTGPFVDVSSVNRPRSALHRRPPTFTPPTGAVRVNRACWLRGPRGAAVQERAGGSCARSQLLVLPHPAPCGVGKEPANERGGRTLSRRSPPAPRLTPSKQRRWTSPAEAAPMTTPSAGRRDPADWLRLSTRAPDQRCQPTTRPRRRCRGHCQRGQCDRRSRQGSAGVSSGRACPPQGLARWPWRGGPAGLGRHGRRGRALHRAGGGRGRRRRSRRRTCPRGGS